MKIHIFLKILTLGLFLFHGLAANAQNALMRGPRIMDNIPNRGRAGVGTKINGPRLPPFRGIGGGGANNNWLHELTSGSSVFNNGTSFLGISADAGLGRLGARLFKRVSVSHQNNGTLREGLQIGLGPLTFGNFTGGVGTFYTDFNTPQGIRDDSGWSSVITLSSAFNLSVPGLSFGGVLSGYYLPFEDKWGYGTPSPVLTFGSQFGMIAPMASIGLGLKGSIAGWDWILCDAFNTHFAHPNIASLLFDDSDLHGSTQSWGRMTATLPSESAIDKVGRYQFGGGAFLERPADATSRIQFPRFSTGGSGGFFNQDRSWFTNTAAAVIGKYVNPVVRNMYWINRTDYWATTDFNYLRDYISGGFYADHVGNEYVKPYFGYEFGTRNNFTTTFHMVNAGSYGNLSPTTTYLVNVGYVYGIGANRTLYDLVLTQRLGYQLSHFLGAGRRVTDPTYGERYIAEYANYGFNILLGPSTTLQAVAGVQQTDGRLTQSGNATASYQGVRLRTTFGSSNISFAAIHENYDFLGGATSQREQWIYKTLYGLPIGGSRTMAYTGYQYIDRHASMGASSFQEHLFLIYMVHRF